MAKIPEFEDYFDKLEKVAKDANNLNVEYGYTKNTKHKGADVPVAQVAEWQEKGILNKDGSWRQPPRRFMTNAEDLNEETSKSFMYPMSEAFLSGSLINVRKVLRKLGERSADDIREAIIYGIYPPLKQSTVDQKGHSQPLIDTEQMYNEADYKITKEGE